MGGFIFSTCSLYTYLLTYAPSSDQRAPSPVLPTLLVSRVKAAGGKVVAAKEVEERVAAKEEVAREVEMVVVAKVVATAAAEMVESRRCIRRGDRPSSARDNRRDPHIRVRLYAGAVSIRIFIHYSSYRSFAYIQYYLRAVEH